MAGEIEFRQALRERVALLKGLPISVLEEVAQSVQLTAGTYELVATLKAMGFKLALISGGFTFFAKRLQEQLGFDYAFANDLEIENGVLTGNLNGQIIDAEGKGRIVQELAEKEGLAREEIVAVGDGANDAIMLKNSGLGIAFNAHDLLKKVADGQLTASNLLGLQYCLGATDQGLRQMKQD